MVFLDVKLMLLGLGRGLWASSSGDSSGVDGSVRSVHCLVGLSDVFRLPYICMRSGWLRRSTRRLTPR